MTHLNCHLPKSRLFCDCAATTGTLIRSLSAGPANCSVWMRPAGWIKLFSFTVRIYWIKDATNHRFCSCFPGVHSQWSKAWFGCLDALCMPDKQLLLVSLTVCSTCIVLRTLGLSSLSAKNQPKLPIIRLGNSCLQSSCCPSRHRTFNYNTIAALVSFLLVSFGNVQIVQQCELNSCNHFSWKTTPPLAKLGTQVNFTS